MQKSMIEIKALMEQTKPLHILYVEDNEEARLQTLKMLQNFFDHVDVAVDGAEGLEKYVAYHDTHQRYHDIVISDINMPNMSGIEMGENIIQMHPDQEMIVISAFNDTANFEKASKVGIKHYLHKPMELNLLIDTIDKVCQTLQAELV
jgi:YesN/AraC family two-component response regulator